MGELYFSITLRMPDGSEEVDVYRTDAALPIGIKVATKGAHLVALVVSKEPPAGFERRQGLIIAASVVK